MSDNDDVRPLTTGGVLVDDFITSLNAAFTADAPRATFEELVVAHGDDLNAILATMAGQTIPGHVARVLDQLETLWNVFLGLGLGYASRRIETIVVVSDPDAGAPVTIELAGREVTLTVRQP